jgi:hypothetical protein
VCLPFSSHLQSDKVAKKPKPSQAPSAPGLPGEDVDKPSVDPTAQEEAKRDIGACFTGEVLHDVCCCGYCKQPQFSFQPHRDFLFNRIVGGGSTLLWPSYAGWVVGDPLYRRCLLVKFSAFFILLPDQIC